MTEKAKDGLAAVIVVVVVAALEFALMYFAVVMLEIPGVTFSRVVGASVLLHLAAMTVKRASA